jgi:small subunit ribosomal protein S6
MEKQNKYLAIFIIDPAKEASMDEVHDRIKKIIGDNSGTITEEKKVGKKQLSYPMRKKKEGIYYKVEFSAPPSSIERISKLYRIDTDILRTLIDRCREKRSGAAPVKEQAS